MLGPMGSTIISILRVLTPGEIDRYTESVEAQETVDIKIAAGAEGFEPTSHRDQSKSPMPSSVPKDEPEVISDDNQAKIIPINQEVREEFERLGQDRPSLPRFEQSRNDNLEIIGIDSNHSRNEKNRLRIEEEDSKKESTTVFILNQREKLKRSQNKLAGQAAIIEYRKSSSQEIYKTDEEDEEHSPSGSTGILINKKQY